MNQSFDQKPNTSQSAWQTLLNQLWKDAERFADLAEQIPERQLLYLYPLLNLFLI